MTETKQTTETAVECRVAPTVPGAPVNLLRKLLEVRKRVGGYIQKDGYNSGQKYSFVSERAFIAAVSSHLNELGVYLSGNVVRATNDIIAKADKVGILSTVEVAFTFWDVETGESIVSTYVGQGHDPTDKASNKALTAALKYALRQGFLVATGDDPEDDGTAERAAEEAAKRARIQRLRDLQLGCYAARVEVKDLPSDEELLAYKVSALDKAIKTREDALNAPEG